MKTIETYLKDLNKNYKTGKAREHTYRPAIINLFQSIKGISLASNENARIECGAPDITVYDSNNIELGYIETKDLDVVLRKEIESEQLERYKHALGNLILTNYLEFFFIKDGHVIKEIKLAKIKSNQIVLIDEEAAQSFINYCNEFASNKSKKIKSSNELAIRMANSALIIKDGIQKAFKDQRYNSSFDEQLAAFKEVLIENLDQDKFADLYAQTVVYGLFVARCFSGEEIITRENASFMLPKTNPFLKKIFTYLAGADLDDRLSWIVENVISLFNKCDFEHIYNELTTSTRSNDPVVDFYEIFLKHFDPEQKKRLGVYYTPAPAVKYIVRSVDKILKNEFKIKDGIASNEKVTKLDKESDKVILLDPATGTGTFLLETIKFIKEKFKGNEGLWDSYVSNNLLKRIFGFEILMAPYTVAHLKLGIELKKLGYSFKNDERLNVYLTNTLEETRDITNMFPFAKWLTEESSNAKKIKKEHPVMVVMGNPPYSGESSNNGEWIKNLLRGKDIETGAKTANYFELQGKPLEEKNTKWLNDDYVKFMRFAQWRIDTTGYGVMAFITNHGFIDNPTFRGMRESLLKDFDKIYILDLHGNTKKEEKTPEGLIDKNIFDIQQGVSISFFVKNNTKEKDALAEVFHADLWGDKRELFGDDNNLIGGKYHWLLNNDVDTTEWKKIEPKYPFLYLNPNESTYDEEYDNYVKITDIFPLNSVGIATARDDLTIQFNKKDVWDTINEFISLSEKEAREHFKIKKDAQDWTIKLAKKDLVDSGPSQKNIIKICYRPFDYRYTYYTGRSKGFHCRPRSEVMNCMKSGKNLALITSRMTKGEEFNHHMVSDCVTEVISLSSKTSNNAFVFPLYSDDSAKNINMSETFLLNIKSLNFYAQSTKTSEIAKDFFYYANAILHSTQFKKRYGYRLEKDFARIPVTSKKALYFELVKEGEQLANAYIFKKLLSVNSKFPEKGSNEIKKIVYEPKQERIYINDNQYFSNISSDVWNYMTGGYQVLNKWLGYRKEQKINFNEISDFLKNVSVIESLIQTCSHIDKIIVKYGGFPFVGASNFIIKKEVKVNGTDDLVSINLPTKRKKLLTKEELEQIIEKRSVLSAYVFTSLDGDSNLMRTKLAKILYTCDMEMSDDLGTNYLRDAAGPLDKDLIYSEKVGVEALGEKYGIFEANTSVRGVKYKIGKNAKAFSSRASSLFKKDIKAIDKVIEIFKPLDTEQSEIVATVYACWNDFLVQGIKPTEEQIIKEFREKWHDKKKRFSSQRIAKAIEWMKQKKLFPKGIKGQTTSKTAKKKEDEVIPF